MDKLLFKNVICDGYMRKKETKHVYHSDVEDEYIETDDSITLNQGGSCQQDIYEFVEKEFEGICVGVFLKNTKREYIDCSECENYYGYGTREEYYVRTNLTEPIPVAKVYYGNNKSRLVPIERIKIWEAPF